MGIASDLTALKTLSDGVVANKVSRFAYTEQAYTDNNANGVLVYDVNNDQNIPVGTAPVMKVNQTVIEKGWRARASSITRMLMNHFLGRISYNLNKVNDWFNTLLANLSASLGTANGIATLDTNGRIPYSQLPESAVELKGYWNASTNTPTLVDGTGTNGDEYFVDTAGEQDLGSGTQYFKVGDRVVYTGGKWKNIDSGSVRKINQTLPDETGNVSLTVGQNVPLSEKLLSGIFGSLLGRVWKVVFTHSGSSVMRTITKFKDIVIYLGTGVRVYTEDGVNFNDLYIEDIDVALGSTVSYNDYGFIVECDDVLILYFRKVNDENTVPYLWYSTNGKDFYKVAGVSDIFVKSGTTRIHRVMYMNGHYYICGYVSGGSYAVYVTTDYTSVLNAEQTTGLIYSIVNSAVYTYANGVYMVNTMLSLDGVNFSISTTSISTIDNILFVNGLWVCNTSGGSSGQGIWWSEDPTVSWTRGQSEVGYGRALVYDKDLERWLSCDTGFRWSDDGKAWTLCSSISSSALAVQLVKANGVWVCATESGMFYSFDLKSWNSTNISKTMSNVAYCNGLFICNATDGTTYISNDGTSWGATSFNGVNNEKLAFSTLRGKWLANNGVSTVSTLRVYLSDVKTLTENGTLDIGYIPN